MARLSELANIVLGHELTLDQIDILIKAAWLLNEHHDTFYNLVESLEYENSGKFGSLN